nr:hypothetical protein [Acidobacteriota bacterium]
MVHLLRLVMSSAALTLLCFSTSLTAQTVVYVAETAAPSRVTGEVTAAKVRWNCGGSTCKTSAPAQLNQQEMCSDLARQVGPLKAYRYGETSLDAAQLQQCNGSKAGKLQVPIPPVIRPSAGQVATQKPAGSPVARVPKELMFKTPEQWRSLYASKLQSAPKQIADAINLKNASLKAAGKSFTVGLTSVYFQPLDRITGLKLPANPS